MEKKISILLVLLILLNCCTKIPREISIDNGQESVKIKIEIADDEPEIMKGLMFRKSMEWNSGMLFIFKDEDYKTFWMKNTLIPLDMVFIDKDFKIVDIKYALPCTQDPCKLYPSLKPAQYVLELNGNFTLINNIREGAKIKIS